ncbi:MAG TPA: LysR family transcriptional regulator [Kiritimatiellia bacterium]|nr:MAG: DNA-binding transcriptional regulator ModE [Verrucomicrobia bacterium ADurb.Bin018]HOE01390.1 LysR family transcriptional regulator [Kiritimatiellia bacterium]HOE36302.1 LysR family transcriptional regulator [Kiritimatiellia bacterium]HOR73687.1 LysR family transcriptional regulator [Kiritimatiellia bacterium]HOU58309.1 LysR family transcriptional regulator [Kiritimatiellia bacterium]
MKLHVRIALATARDEEFCGAGVLELLAGIARHGSIQQAARDMGLSYVKALRILNQTEKELGLALLERRKGGAQRGSTALTPTARRFVRDFTRLRATIQKSAQQAFRPFQRVYERKKETR